MKFGKILILITAAFLSIVLYLNKCNKEESTQNKSANPGSQAAITVNGTIAKGSAFNERIQVTGTILSNKEVELRNEIAGRLIKIYFQEGGKITKGDLLIKIYDEDLQAQMRKLKLEQKLAQINERRAADLLAINGISKQEYDESLNSFNQIEVEIDMVKVQISKTEIRAPFSGYAGLEEVNEGTYLNQNSKIVSIQELDPVKLEFSVPERYKNMLKPGQLLQFRTESGLKDYEARIYAIEPKIDPQTRSVLVRASCPNPTGLLTPGAFATISLSLATVDNALMIPSEAIVPELKGHKLYIVKNGLAVAIKIEIGTRNDSTVQILSGIDVGDTVLTNGIMQLKASMPVKVNLK